jgi:hypothetical protein
MVCLSTRMYRYATEHWIGSSVSVVPCDLAQQRDLRLWWTTETRRDMPRFNFSMAPRTQDTNFEMIERVKRKLQNWKPSRIREMYYLMGKLVRWKMLYGSGNSSTAHWIPSSTSWIWDYFADGAEWRAALFEHGEEAFSILSDLYPL